MNRSVISDSSVMTHEEGGEAREEDKGGLGTTLAQGLSLERFPAIKS